MANRLSGEISPYLLQHAENPVAWYPWGPEALEEAQRRQCPIFLSIGYSACHWCHVMAHESFEHEGIAALLNEQFVSIKVDREERPDLDQLYMEAVQAISGHGGWPMSVFLTPDREPFFGGTYWPPEDRSQMPGFGRVLEAILEAWRSRRDEVQTQASRIAEALRESRLTADQPEAVGVDTSPLMLAERMLEQSFDQEYGGFGQAPKFPQPTSIRLLFRRGQDADRREPIEMATRTLDAMAAGGIHDHLGGGFHRYAVDRQWLVPHFEKMLYDNAQLTTCYVEAYRATGHERYARVVRDTCDYVLREMTLPEGGFASTQDADTEGEEGKFYIWTPGEIREVLGPDRAELFCQAYDITEAGNFEGRNIPHLARPLHEIATEHGITPEQLDGQLAEARRELLAARAKRTPPDRDDKVILAWNALMIDALAQAGQALNEPRYTDAATRAAEFCLRVLTDAEGRLRHCWRAVDGAVGSDGSAVAASYQGSPTHASGTQGESPRRSEEGQVRGVAFLDDQAALAAALLTLHEVDAPASDEASGDGDPSASWLNRAVELTDDLIDRFADKENGGFFFTPHDSEPLIARLKDAMDASTPSGNGLAATLLLRLGEATDRDDLSDLGEHTLKAFWPILQRIPNAAGQLLLALRHQQAVTAE